MDQQEPSSVIGLDSEQITARYDAQTRILHVTYRGVLTPAVSAQFYNWLTEQARTHPEVVSTALGSIYDFRQVTRFESTNISSAQRQSQQVNREFDFSHHPVALIADTLYMQQLLAVTMKITPQMERKRIVSSPEEAVEFISSFA